MVTRRRGTKRSSTKRRGTKRSSTKCGGSPKHVSLLRQVLDKLSPNSKNALSENRQAKAAAKAASLKAKNSGSFKLRPRSIM